MEFKYAEVKTQEVLEELKKVKNVVCINSILDNVPDDVIVLGQIAVEPEDKTIQFGDISDLSISDSKRIIIMIPKMGEEQEE